MAEERAKKRALPQNFSMTTLAKEDVEAQAER
jgi:hypothetical protein